jgi:hypothetical protein
MKSERLVPALIALSLVSSLLSAPQASRTERTPVGAAVGTKPLIRKDLLVFSRGEIPPPRRDIFRPRDNSGPVVSQAPLISPSVLKRQTHPANKLPAFALNLVYLGSVRSGGKIVALVLRDGQTEPVAEGDEIVPGYKVLRITPDEIEVEGPNSERKTFSRQGDRP